MTRFPVRVSENETFVDLDESVFNRDYEKVWKPQTVKVVMSEDSARDVISNYDLIFSAKLRRAVAEQKPWTLEGSSDGIGIEGGFIWMSDPSQNGSFKVTSIFAPP
jgi:hypothetical protein